MSSFNPNLGLLYTRVLDLFPLNDKKFGMSKLLTRIGEQGYIRICDLSNGGIELNEVRVFECKKDDYLRLKFTDDKTGD